MDKFLIHRAAELIELKACFDKLEDHGYISDEAKADIIAEFLDTSISILDEIVCTNNQEVEE